jgi:hypothetical protein
MMPIVSIPLLSFATARCGVRGEHTAGSSKDGAAAEVSGP